MDVLTLEPVEDAEARVPFFKVGDTVYDVPAKPDLGVAVRFLTRVLNGGGLVAELALLEDLLTVEGYETLLNLKISPENLRVLVDKAEKHVLGPLERPGNSQSGSEKSAG